MLKQENKTGRGRFRRGRGLCPGYSPDWNRNVKGLGEGRIGIYNVKRLPAVFDNIESCMVL